MITLKQLREMVAAQPAANDHLEVKIWLPGSTLSLEFNSGRMLEGKAIRKPEAIMIEGNLDEGSALMRD